MTDIILFFLGILIGAMNAIAGGGMLFGFPIMLALGIPALTINATSNAIVLPGNVAAAWGYRKYLKRVPRKYLYLLIPAIAGGAIGATALKHTSSESFENFVPWLICFAVLLFAFQPYLHRQLHLHLHGPKRLRKTLKPLVIVGVAVFPLSIYGGYYGAGFGFIMLAFLGFTKLHDHIHRMNALKSIITTCLATTSLVCLAGSGLVNWRYGLIMGAGNMIGGYTGAISIQKVSTHIIRIIIIVAGVASAIYMGLISY